MEKVSFTTKLKDLLDEYSLESSSDTPTWMLAEYMVDCLMALNNAIVRRDTFYGDDHRPKTKSDGDEGKV